MKDLEKVLVMSNDTWSAVKDRMFEKARNHDDPIGYLGMMNGMDVIIDDRLPFNSVEVYYKWVYEQIVKAEREKKKYDI
jgi:hypothetical protein